MEELTKEEIQAQLRKLGIKSSDELNHYSEDYKAYSINNNPHSSSSEMYQTRLEMTMTNQRTLARRFARSCRSLFPVLGNFFASSRVKTYKK